MVSDDKHVHFIAIPGHENSLAKGFGEAHKRYTRQKNFTEGVRGYLFQGRFSSCVLDESHLIAAVHYVVVGGLCLQEFHCNHKER